MVMAETEVLVLCYLNGCIRYGPDGVYYQGSTRRMIKVKQKTELKRFVDGMYIITGIDKQRSKFEIFGRYPLVVSPHRFTYVHFPVVDDSSLETMLEVPSNHPCINSVEFCLQVVDVATCSSSLENPDSSSKRARTDIAVKLERDIGLEIQQVNAEFGNGYAHGDGEMTDQNSGSNGVAQTANLAVDNSNTQKDLIVPYVEPLTNASLNKWVDSKPRVLSSLWLDDHELRVGLCFKSGDELKKAVDWCSIRGRQKCVVQETKKDEFIFKCIRWKCNWSVCAARIEEHGLIEITKCNGLHTCCPLEPENFDVELAAEEIECLIRVQPTLTVAELESWWCGKFGYELETGEMQAAKLEAIKKIYGEWDQSFRLLPKLMAALHSSNGLVMDWQYDPYPNPEFASFRGVFWAFSQSIEGFTHCRPLIIVESKDLNNDKYPMTLMIASGVDANYCFFPLAFAITKEVSVDSWRWFLTGIREKVTQREDICLISSLHPDILSVINEPESKWREPWAYHRFCLDHLSSKFHDVFQNSRLKSLMQQAGSTKQQDEFDSHMESIKKENPEARKWLDQMRPHQWALAHDGGRRYEIMTINLENLFPTSESCWSYGLPVTAAVLLLFDDLRLDFQNSHSGIHGRISRGDKYTKPVMDKLEEFRTASVAYIVMPLDNNTFQVTEQKNKWIVQLSECTCTCGDFQSKKFPCLHVLAVCEKLKINPLMYVDDCYTLEKYYKTYAATFSPVPEISAWPEALGVPTLFPPVIVKQEKPELPCLRRKERQTKELARDQELENAVFP